MKKMIFALCAVATLSVAVISCSKKDDTDDTTTTTTTATTSTTSTTSTTTPTDTIKRPTATKNTLVIDTNVVGYNVTSCGPVAQGRWELKAAVTTDLGKILTATFGTLKGFTTTYTINTSLPAMGAQQVLLGAQIDSLYYSASAGVVTLNNDTGGKVLIFKDIKFTHTGRPDLLISGNLSCQ